METGLSIVVRIVCLRLSQRPKSSSHREKTDWLSYTNCKNLTCCAWVILSSPRFTGKGSLLSLQKSKFGLLKSGLGPNLALLLVSSELLQTWELLMAAPLGKAQDEMK